MAVVAEGGGAVQRGEVMRVIQVSAARKKTQQLKRSIVYLILDTKKGDSLAIPSRKGSMMMAREL